MSTSMSTLPTTSTYIDLTKLTSPTFSAHQYANDLVRSVNTTSTSHASHTSDSLVDLTTPLQKTLFDLQEIDTNIHSLTSKSALDILTYTQRQNAAAQRILSQVEEERTRLVTNFQRLQTEILGRYERAEKARVGAERSLLVLRLARNVQRVLSLGRAFETAMTESKLGDVQSGKEDHHALLQATNVALSFRDLISSVEAQKMELSRVSVVRQVRGRIFEDGEERLKDWARRVVREFSVHSFLTTGSSMNTTLGGSGSAEDAKARFQSAVHVLYLLSPTPRLEGGRKMRKSEFEADDLLRSLQAFVQSAVSSSAAGIGRGLGQLPGLERALSEVSGRCLSVRALEVILSDIKPPADHPLLDNSAEHASASKKNARKQGSRINNIVPPTKSTASSQHQQHQEDNEDTDTDLSEEDSTDKFTITTITTAQDPSSSSSTTTQETILDMLLTSLDTSSLPSYFWRSLASSLSVKVQEIMNRGGVSARTLKSNKEIVRVQIRECVLKGAKMPGGLVGHGGREVVVENWEREAAVMVGSVVGPLGR